MQVLDHVYSRILSQTCVFKQFLKLIPQWKGMGDVVSARYEPALLPPCPTVRVLGYSNSRDPMTPFLSEFSEI